MDNIIEPIDLKLIQKELNLERFVRESNNANNEIYIVNHHNSPNTTKEIGRLREITFRTAGGGTGKPYDLDDFDTRPEAFYNQLIVWAPESKEIIGGYRFIKCNEALKSEAYSNLATSNLFHFSDQFIQDYMPYTIELGRSFVQPHFQPSKGSRKGIFSLDNLWDGLGALVVDEPEIKYFFGKITMYPDFDKTARDYILSFMNYFFPDKEELLTTLNPLPYHHNTEKFINELSELNYQEAYKVLQQKVRELDENVPPLVGAYMSLSSTMKTFGTALNTNFGDVEETGILVTIDDIFEVKKERHINTYIKKNSP
jgi:hypothetical protein